MRSVRARLAVFTVMLLGQQVAALAMAGALACCTTAAAPAPMECCENAGEGHMCPLANRRAPEGGCRMKNGCSTSETGMLAGAGFVYAAPLVGRFTIVPPLVHPHAWQVVVAAETFANTPPLTPPPKA